MDELDQNIPVPDELTVLKARATTMGINFHPSIGVDKLREKIQASLDNKPDPDEQASSAAVASTPAAVVESDNAKRLRLKQEALRLVRIRVTCMNPAKKEWEGEIFTSGNAVIGSVKKFVPFNADEGWHVPHCIYQVMKDRMCQVFVNGKSRDGVTVRQGKMIKEFAIEVLPQLTKDELDELARRQAMSKSID
jgi:hypothetical protein